MQGKGHAKEEEGSNVQQKRHMREEMCKEETCEGRDGQGHRDMQGKRHAREMTCEGLGKRHAREET